MIAKVEELLREAARVMRERAQAATPGPWQVCDRGPANGGGEIANLCTASGVAVANAGGGGRAFLAADAEHASAWHPAVALAVADWLEAVSEYQMGDTNELESAETVARAYLGRRP